jgi:polygalacturonase
MSYNITKLLNEADEDISIIQHAVDDAAKNGGGKVTVPAGQYVSAPIRLYSNIELHLEAGSSVTFIDDPERYPVITASWEGTARDVYMPCVYARDAVNVSVTGFGTLNGGGAKWWDWYLNNDNRLAYPRPTLINFINCEDVTLKNITLVNSPSWTVHPFKCNRVTIDNVKIKNPSDSPNTDGINPESCKNVHITDCFIDVGDDCIAIKSGTEDMPERVACENISISGCTMVHGHGAIVIGSEMSGGIRNVVVSGCIFQKTDRGIRLKSRRGRGGCVEDLRFNNIIMDDVICPFVINLYYFCGDKGKDKYVWDKNPYPVTDETPCFKRLHFSDISASNVHAAAGFIYGLAERYVSDVTFSNIQISMAENAVAGKPAMMSGMEDMKRQGFFIAFAENVSFKNVTVENHEQSAFYIAGIRDVEIKDCVSLRPRQEGLPLIHKAEH